MLATDFIAQAPWNRAETVALIKGSYNSFDQDSFINSLQVGTWWKADLLGKNPGTEKNWR